jgi:acyl-coenzyme A synthetase/AMP-(fatty) acid ligase
MKWDSVLTLVRQQSGKILRKLLREKAAQEVGDKKPAASKLS